MELLEVAAFGDLTEPVDPEEIALEEPTSSSVEQKEVEVEALDENGKKVMEGENVKMEKKKQDDPDRVASMAVDDDGASWSLT